MRNNTMNIISKIAILTAVLCLTCFVLVGCGGGGGGTETGDPHDPNQGPFVGSVTGRSVNLAGNPVGGGVVAVVLRDQNGNAITPTINPGGPQDGADYGVFDIPGAPLGQQLFLDIVYTDNSIGANVGTRLLITVNSTELDLGDVALTSNLLDLGWSAYRYALYEIAMDHFENALLTYPLSEHNTHGVGDTFRSSSAYDGLGWCMARRGRRVDNVAVGLNKGFEWESAITKFDQSLGDNRDADAWVGRAGAYLTLLHEFTYLPQGGARQGLQFNDFKFYWNEISESLSNALALEPDFISHHDAIVANDLRVMNTFIQYMQTGQALQSQIDQQMGYDDINLASQQTLDALTDLRTFIEDPQWGSATGY